MATIFWNLIFFYSQVIVIIYPPVLLFWIIFHSRIDFWRSMGKRAYWYSCAVWPLVSGPMLVFRESVFAPRWPSPRWLVLTGLMVLVAAAWLTRRAARIISWRTLLGIVELEPQKNVVPLMKSGIYARTRNPLYLMHALLVFAAAALSGYVAAWGLVALDVVLLPVMIRTEERELQARYGREYEEYMRQVPRFFPRLSGGA